VRPKFRIPTPDLRRRKARKLELTKSRQFFDRFFYLDFDTEHRREIVRLRNWFFIIAIALSIISTSVFAARKGKRVVTSAEGKITDLKNGKDRKHKRYWEYRLRTAAGKSIIVHDYQYGRYRQPAGMGIQEGAKRKVRGFYVHISTQMGSSKKEPVLIVSPAN
jgi:hypothetical protein